MNTTESKNEINEIKNEIIVEKNEINEIKNEINEIKSEIIADKNEINEIKSEIKVIPLHTKVNTERNQVNANNASSEIPQSLQVNATKSMPISLRVKTNDYDWWNDFKMSYETIPEAFSALVKLASKPTETKTVEKTIEVIKEIELSPSQIIVSIGSDTADKISACRPLIARGDVLNYEKGNDESFLSALTNFCINKTLERNFPRVIRLLKNEKSKS